MFRIWAFLLNFAMASKTANQQQLGCLLRVCPWNGALVFFYVGFCNGLEEAVTSFLQSYQDDAFNQKYFEVAKDVAKEEYFYSSACTVSLAM